jgi:hypothetical protein
MSHANADYEGQTRYEYPENQRRTTRLDSAQLSRLACLPGQRAADEAGAQREKRRQFYSALQSSAKQVLGGLRAVNPA